MYFCTLQIDNNNNNTTTTEKFFLSVLCIQRVVTLVDPESARADFDLSICIVCRRQRLCRYYDTDIMLFPTGSNRFDVDKCGLHHHLLYSLSELPFFGSIQLSWSNIFSFDCIELSLIIYRILLIIMITFSNSFKVVINTYMALKYYNDMDISRNSLLKTWPFLELVPGEVTLILAVSHFANWSLVY